MRSRRYVITTPEFSKYVYSILLKATDMQIAELTETEMKIFKSVKTMEEFSRYETFEKKLDILAKLGYDWVLLMSPEGDNIDETIETSENVYKYPKKRIDHIEGMNRNGVFALSSVQVLIQALMCSQNAVTKVYDLSYTSKLLSKFSTMWNTNNQQISEADEAYQNFARILLAVMEGKEYVEAVAEISQIQMKIMLSLFINPHVALTHKDMGEMLRVSQQSAKKDCEFLAENGYIFCEIDKVKSNKRKVDHYMLKGKGTKIVFKYVQYIFDKLKH